MFGIPSASPTITAIAVILSIVAAVLAAIFIMPQKRVPKLNKFMYVLHKIINFKGLLLEKILKILYVFSTCVCLITGFLYLFYYERGDSYFGYSIEGRYYGGYGLLLIILGPIFVRMIFEGIMMFILLVNNTNEIRKKLCDISRNNPDPQDTVCKEIKPHYVFCSQCGTRYDANSGGCPNGCNLANDTAAPAGDS